MLNPHHLELFYYVARHGGISRGLRHMPYGIQQPAVSGQILQLEQNLGLKLFERAPFRLTPAGEELYAFVRPFFENLDEIEARLHGGSSPLLRIGASETVLRDHLPAVLRVLRAGDPRLRFSLRSGYQPQLEGWLLERQIDLAIAALDTRPGRALRRLPLVRLPLALLVPRRSRLRDAEELWESGRLDEPLISPPPSETLCRNFQRGLESRGLAWTPAIVAGSLDTLAYFVADGYGFGVTLAGTTHNPRVRELPLAGFDPIEIVALWCGKPGALVETALAEMRAYVKRKWPQRALV